MTDWIAVADRLPVPRPGQDVYLCSGPYDTYILCVYYGLRGFIEWREGGEPIPVTHWAELEPPQVRINTELSQKSENAQIH